MKLFRSINKRIVSVALATAMAFGFAVAPVPSMLDGGVVGQSVAYAAPHNVTALPYPDAEGQGGGSSAPLSMYEDRFSTIRKNDTDVPTNAMLLIAYNKNVTSKRPNYDDPLDMIMVNADKFKLVEVATGQVITDGGSIVSQAMIDSALENNPSLGGLTERNYRNYIYINSPVLKANTSYRIEISAGVTAANGQIINNPDIINFTTGSY